MIYKDIILNEKIPFSWEDTVYLGIGNTIKENKKGFIPESRKQIIIVLTSKSGFGKLIDKKKLKMPKTLFLTQYNIKNGDEKAGIHRNKLYKLSDKILADLNISKDEKISFLL